MATPSNILMVNSWYQKDKIHVYLANTGKVPLSLTIGIGTYLSGDRVFESKEVRIDAKTVKTIELPVITKEFKRGKRVSDTVFVYQDTDERSGGKYIQVLFRRRDEQLTNLRFLFLRIACFSFFQDKTKRVKVDKKVVMFPGCFAADILKEEGN